MLKFFNPVPKEKDTAPKEIDSAEKNESIKVVNYELLETDSAIRPPIFELSS